MNRKKFWLPVILAVVAVGALALVFLPGDAGDVPPEMTAPVQTLPPETTLPPQTQPQKQTIDTVPRYLQTDYPYTKYGNGTIGTSGCSITCLAMVASPITPTRLPTISAATAKPTLSVWNTARPKCSCPAKGTSTGR